MPLVFLAVAVALSAAPGDAARLAARLGSEDHAEREAATEALVDMGGAALPALRAALDAPDPETRRRAAEALDRIERRLETAEVLRPRTLRLTYRDAPLADAVADFSRRTGLAVRLADGVAARRVTLDTGDVPLWEAYGRLLAAAGLTETGPVPPPRVEKQIAARKLVLLDGPLPETAPAPLGLADGREVAATFVSGALRIRAAVPPRGAGAASGDWPLTLDVRADPRLGWEGLVRLRLERVLDGRGRPLEHGGGVVAPPYSPLAHLADDAPAPPDPNRVVVMVRLGPDAGPCLREVRGVVAVRLSVPHAELARLPAAPGGVVPTPDGGSVQVQEVTDEGDGAWKVRVRVTLPPEPEPPPGVIVVRVNRGASGRTLIDRAAGAPLALLDAAGRPLALATGDYLTSDRTLSYSLVFQAARGQAPATLVYSGPRVALVDVPFVLTDVPLTAP